MNRIPLLFLSATATAFAALPAVGPDYVKPAIAAPADWRDAGESTRWKNAAPADALARGAWWTLFGDATLSALEMRALAANQDLAAAAARVEQVRASAGLARSAYWPQVAANASVAREQSSTTVENALPRPLSTTYRLPLAASWELDLFGRVRRLAESARADLDASAATFESLRLALTAEVATNYFSLRAAERESVILSEGVALRRRALELAQSRHKAGASTDLDVARAETELATTEADRAAVSNRRAALESALAVLLGESPTGFALPEATVSVNPPAVPAGLPAELLERRPDIAAAERALAAANARIGVAKAAFFPAISLTGTAGFASGQIDDLFQRDSRLWSIGPSLYLPIFQGGRNRANLERSRAVFEENVALFRQRVLVAFREVQDALTAERFLAEEVAAQDRATQAARRATQLAHTRYAAGYVAFLEVIDAERTQLTAERVANQLASQRLNTRVALIKALGGGWQRSAEAATFAAR